MNQWEGRRAREDSRETKKTNSIIQINATRFTMKSICDKGKGVSHGQLSIPQCYPSTIYLAVPESHNRFFYPNES